MYALGLQDIDIDKIEKIPLAERLPSNFLKVFECEIPEPKDDEVLVKIFGAGLNYNSVWQSICSPLSSKSLIEGHVRRNSKDIHHLKNYYIFGSDGAGTISKVGAKVKNWKIGDQVVIHCNVVPTHEKNIDDMKSLSQSIWGYETNFGSFAEYTCVKYNQLLKKPAHLSWPEAGSYMLTLGTAYRMLASINGAKIQKGENCLIWGGAGGLGSFAIQICKMIGAKSIAIVSNSEKANYCKSLGADFVINLSEFGSFEYLNKLESPNYLFWKKFKNKINDVINGEVDVVFEHIGKDTLGFSIYILKKGGRVVTCAASSGYLAKIDLRYLWMEVKSLIGSHFANLQEAEMANKLMINKTIKPVTNKIIKFDQIPIFLDKMYNRENVFGKIGINF